LARKTSLKLHQPTTTTWRPGATTRLQHKKSKVASRKSPTSIDCERAILFALFILLGHLLGSSEGVSGERCGENIHNCMDVIGNLRRCLPTAILHECWQEILTEVWKSKALLRMRFVKVVVVVILKEETEKKVELRSFCAFSKPDEKGAIG